MMDMDSLMIGSVTGDNGTDWGGVDEGGNKDPDANSASIWEEDRAWNGQSLFFDEEQ